MRKANSNADTELSPSELAQVTGGSDDKGKSEVFDKLWDFAGDTFDRLAGPTLDGWGQDINAWVLSGPSVEPVPYEAPIMSAEPNMTMAGGGNGTDGYPSAVTYYSPCGG